MTTKIEVRKQDLSRGTGHDDAVDRPGPLRGNAKLTVQTWQCQRLVYGRRKAEGTGKDKSIIGLIRFSSMMKQILVGAAVDDPYADMFLLRIDDAIKEARLRIRAFHDDVTSILDAQDLKIDVSSSVKPISIDLSFANPYGYMGAYLLADYDRLVRAVLTAKHVALINREQGYRLVSKGAYYIRSVFVIPSTYKYLAIKREDVRQGTKRALDARQLMGELPPEVLAGEWRSDNAPAIKGVSGADDDDSMELNEPRILEAMPG